MNHVSLKRHIPKSMQSIVTRIFRRNLSTNIRTFSGIQPTGALHLGNYLGAVQNWTNLSSHVREDNIYSIVDLHALTTPPCKKLGKNVLEMGASLLACGLDPTKVILFQQSKVSQHTELAWILSCLVSLSSLSRLSQYKEKSAKMSEIPLGLYIYPVLQAADILLYHSNRIPIGEDNLQNVEMARRIQIMFTQKYGPYFAKPESFLSQKTPKIYSLRNPQKKMSKSDEDTKSCIFICDSPDEIVIKFKKALTDSYSSVTYDPKIRPGVSNLIQIHGAFTGQSPEFIVKNYQNINTGEYKILVADIVIEALRPIREEYNRYMKNINYVNDVIESGNNSAREIAEKTMKDVRNLVNFH